MQIKAKIPLSLPNVFHKVTLRYDTFQKATYDSYLIAALINNATCEKEIIKYIDDITGNGSLNNHFLNMYSKMKLFTKEQISRILEDSMYPITIVDEKNHFKYYPIFNATRFNGKVYKGNLSENEDLLKTMIMPKGGNCVFLSLDLKVEDGTIKSDIYNGIFSDEGISIDLDDRQYWKISKENFDSVYFNELDGELLKEYKGTIKEEMSEGDWLVLQNKTLEALLNVKNNFFNDEGAHCSISDDYLKKTEIIKVFSLYFYKETLIKYEKKNSEICEEVVRFLLSSKGINEFRTKSLTNLLNLVDDELAQESINYVLKRKDSKDIALVGLKLIEKGLEKGWELETLRSMKKACSSSEFRLIYGLDSSLEFDTTELLSIETSILTEEDKRRKNDYLTQKENIIKVINSLIGEITNSAVREKMKKLATKDSVHQKFNKFLNKYIGHKQKDYSSYNLEMLIKEHDYISGVFNNEFYVIKERCERNENK